MSLPTKEQIEEYIESVEELLSTSLAAVTPDLDALQDRARRIWTDLTRYGPPDLATIQDSVNVRLPGLGSFEIPPAPPAPPPPPPTPTTMMAGGFGGWVGRNRLLAGSLCFAVGTGLLIGCYTASGAVLKAHSKKKSGHHVRRQVVIVLGGDTPLGLPLVLALEKQGYIVIASVSSADAVEELESQTAGFVRALVLDPTDPATTPYFLRSLQATLSLRFPLNAPGDPYQSSLASRPYVHSLISLLTLPSPSSALLPAPFEHISMTSTYTPYLTQTHITPLQVIQGILPLFRRDAASRRRDGKCIIVCIPASDARVGVPFAAAHAMSAAATVRGIEILRREIKTSVATSEDSESMAGLKIVLVDVGSISPTSQADPEQLSAETMAESVSTWTTSEKAVYGHAFYSALQHVFANVPRRKPAGIDDFVKPVIKAVGGPARRHGSQSTIRVGLRLWQNKIWNFIHGQRFSVGSGAHTYAVASYLPRPVLDFLLNLSTLLSSWRYRTQPHIPLDLPPPPPPPASQINPEVALPQEKPGVSPPLSDGEKGISNGGSEADIESESDDLHDPSVGSSWVSLQE